MPADARPNILFILVDQLGARWLPSHGNPIVSAPALENFAAGSAVFDRAISTSPICTPYRGCLLSGMYPSQTGVRQNGQAFPAGLPSVADHLNAAGYATQYIGKWHLSGAPQSNRWVPPGRRAGFQRFIGWESHHVDHWDGRLWEDDPETSIVMPGHETDALTEIALEQLVALAASPKPFFMLVSYQAPHPPCSPPAEFEALYAGQDLLPEPNADRDAWYRMPQWNADYAVERFRQRYFGEISQMDAAFGRLLQALDQLSLSDNALVVFTSDHGEMAGAHGRFGKGSMFEESLHVPLMIRAPGQEGGLRVGCPAATLDLLPTLLDYAGCPPPSKTEGISLRPVVESSAGAPERVVFSEFHDFCATDGRWKLLTRGRSLELAALYDIADDPYELDNRIHDDSCAVIQAKLGAALEQWHERVGLPAESERA